MNVHVSFHPALTSSTDTVKVSEPVVAGFSFSQALSSASQATTARAAHGASDHDGEKKPQKKAEDLKDDARGASSSAGATPTPATPVPASQLSPALPVHPERGDESGRDGGDANDTIAPNSLGSDSATSAPKAPVNSTPLSGDGGGSEAGQGAGVDSSVSASSTSTDDGSAMPVTEDAGASKGAILAPSDESSVAVPPFDPGSPLLQGVLPDLKAAVASAGGDEDGATKVATQAVKATNDDPTVTVPVMLPAVAVAAPGSTAPMNLPSGMDVNTTVTAGSPSASGIEIKPNGSKAGSAGGRDRAVSETHGRGKTAEADGAGQSGASTALPAVKVAETPGAASQQGNNGGAAQDAQTVQMVQASLAQPATQADVAPHAAAATQTPDAPVQSAVAHAQSGLEVAGLPGLSTARLIQSVHQSEMKLGMNSAEFGTISISTSVTHQAISAQISLDHSELGRALAAHLPAMEERLGAAYGLQARVEVRGEGSAAQSDSSRQSSSGQQNQRSKAATHSSALSSGVGAVAARSSSLLAGDTSRLDIRI